MKENSFAKKAFDFCSSGKPWYFFLGMQAALALVAAIIPAENKRKRAAVIISILSGALLCVSGIVDSSSATDDGENG